MCCDRKSLLNGLSALITAASKSTTQEDGAPSNRVDKQHFLTGIIGDDWHDGSIFHRVGPLNTPPS